LVARLESRTVGAGILIAESLRIGSWLQGHFGTEDEDLERLAEALAESLEDVGWYADFHTEKETFVVFSGRVFRYASGDSVARAKAESYARERGVPDTQIDWS
jgi:hypothetical protein